MAKIFVGKGVVKKIMGLFYGQQFVENRTTLRTKIRYSYGTKSRVAQNLHISSYTKGFAHKNQRRYCRSD